jgi:hypothetical protein
MESAATESRRPRLLRLSPEMLRDMAELKSAQSSDPARLAFLSTCAEVRPGSRTHPERPRGGRAAEQRYEVAPVNYGLAPALILVFGG